MAMRQAPVISLGEASSMGLRPERHIAGFSIHQEDGSLLPLIRPPELDEL